MVAAIALLQHRASVSPTLPQKLRPIPTTPLLAAQTIEHISQLHRSLPERVTTDGHTALPRAVNYGYYQPEGISIGSGAVESTVKQIGRRVKSSGAQWEKDNVPQVFKHRCAYLNGQFSK